ncbi:MAG TPA: carboxymuconolactone decarboxylase family protein [Pseudonocardiaceae bacterium]|nr:carboxymuconolactone decarboxylase family protein [Pseudonocardiaceae bacterium]
MTDYPIQTIDTAPAATRPALTGLHAAFGLIPNVAGVMANSPALLNSFFSAFGHFRGETGTFTPAERQVLLLSNAINNDCPWAVAFHSVEAIQDGVAPEVVAALRGRAVPAEPRMAALAGVSKALIDKRGHLDETDAKAFTSAGFDDNQLLEAIASVAISTMTNYAGNLADPPLEAAFQSQVWDAQD